MIKMDIEGAELYALDGMQKMIVDNPNLSIICEYKPDIIVKTGLTPIEFIEKIRNYGFIIEPIGESEIKLNDYSSDYGINLLLKKDLK